MQELTMNQVKNSMNGVLVHPIPLFASSWVALFCLLRSNLAKSRSEPGAEIEHENAGKIKTRH